MRMRRLRRTDRCAPWCAKRFSSPATSIYPLFICPGEGVRREVSSMPGVFNLSVDEAVREAEEAARLGLGGLLLFGLPETKDEHGTGAWDDDGIVQQGLRALKPIRRRQKARPHRRRLPLRVHQPRPLRHRRSKPATASKSTTTPPSICSPAPPSAWPRPAPTSSPPAT